MAEHAEDSSIIGPSMSKESLVQGTSLTNGDVVALIGKQIEGHVNSLKRKLEAENGSRLKKMKSLLDVSFNYNGNREQYLFNSEVKEGLEDICSLLQEEEVGIEMIEQRINQVLQKVEHRNKLIRIADRSEAGWETVREFQRDDLADDSEEERKIRASESRALQKIKRKKLRRQQKPSAAVGRVEDQSFRPPKDQYKKSYFNQRRPGVNDICFQCGEKGHWSYQCESSPQKEDHQKKTDGSHSSHRKRE